MAKKTNEAAVLGAADATELKVETPAAFTATAPPAAPSVPPEIATAPAKQKPAKTEVRARVIFADALTGRNFRPGSLVEGWDEARVAHYVERGLVVVHSMVGPSEFK